MKRIIAMFLALVMCLSLAGCGAKPVQSSIENFGDKSNVELTIEAVNALLNEEMNKAVALIREHRETMDRLVEALIAKNHLSGDEVQAILSAGVKR